MGSFTQRDKVNYSSEWTQGQNQNFEVRKLLLPIHQNLPSTDMINYIMSLNTDLYRAAIHVLLWYASAINWRREKNWAILFDIFCHCCCSYFVNIVFSFMYIVLLEVFVSLDCFFPILFYYYYFFISQFIKNLLWILLFIIWSWIYLVFFRHCTHSNFKIQINKKFKVIIKW